MLASNPQASGRQPSFSWVPPQASWAAIPPKLSQHRRVWLNTFLVFQQRGFMRWLCARWLRFRSAQGFSYQLSARSKVCTRSPELHCPVLSSLILLSFSLFTVQRPAELKDLSNPFLSLLGRAHLMMCVSVCVCTLFPSVPHNCMWSASSTWPLGLDFSSEYLWPLTFLLALTPPHAHTPARRAVLFSFSLLHSMIFLFPKTAARLWLCTLWTARLVKKEAGPFLNSDAYTLQSLATLPSPLQTPRSEKAFPGFYVRNRQHHYSVLHGLEG